MKPAILEKMAAFSGLFWFRPPSYPLFDRDYQADTKNRKKFMGKTSRFFARGRQSWKIQIEIWDKWHIFSDLINHAESNGEVKSCVNLMGFEFEAIFREFEIHF